MTQDLYNYRIKNNYEVQDVFNENIPLMDTITKYFKFTDDMSKSEQRYCI